LTKDQTVPTIRNMNSSQAALAILTPPPLNMDYMCIMIATASLFNKMI